ncbi:MAG: PepSY domain-containing protein [Gemmatimonadetes bacterium]|nr:PepSY domain-containing protein [Gemmatimonadota bacterium]
MRDAILVVHRWLGLTVGMVFGIASLTGAGLVFETEIDALLNRDRFVTTAGLITPSGLDAGLQRILGQGELRHVRWPTAREPVFEVAIADAAGVRTVWLDPGTGAAIEPRRGRNRIVPAIRRVHTTLFAGYVGHWVVTLSCMAALIGLITGSILWWPGRRRLARGFTIRMRRGAHVLNYDLHQTLGILAFPLLIVLTATGVLIPFPRPAEQAARIILRTGPGARGWAPAISSPSAAPAALRLDTLIERAQHAAALSSPPELVLYPARADGVIDVRLRTRPFGETGGSVRVLMDRYSGSVLQVRDPRDLDRARRFATVDVFNVHIGAIGGPLVRALWFVACLIGALSLPTGVLVWWLRGRRVQCARWDTASQ